MQEKVPLIKRLYAGYVAYHQNGPRMLMYMGIVGVTVTPLLYLLRYSKSVSTYDDLWLRVVDTILLALMLPNLWPARFQRYYMPVSYLSVIVVLPFTWVFVALQNGGGTVAVANAFFATAMVILLSDWRNTIAVLCMGTGAAVSLYLLVNPSPEWPKDYVERLPLLFVFMIASSLIKRALEETTEEKTRKLEQKLAASRAAALQETIGFLAHELNTPLVTVRLAVSEVADRYIGPGTDNKTAVFQEGRQGDVIAALRRAGQRAHYCQSLVDSFMKSAYHHRLDGPQDVMASNLINSLTAHYPFEPHEQEFVECVVNADFPISGPRELLYLVMATLIKNALLALRTQPEPKILIQAIGDAPDFRTGFIRVSDNGCGIEADALTRLTKQAVASSWPGGDGRGMGLMFCQRVMEASGGYIDLASVQGQGTSVTLRFGKPDVQDRRPAEERHPMEIGAQPAQT